MTAKTILAQLVQKSQLFSKMNKNLVLICQTPLYDYMAANFKEALQNPHLRTMGEADLFKRVTFDQVLKSVESSRER